MSKVSNVSNMFIDSAREDQEHAPTMPSDEQFEAGQLETDFLAVISHELRTPLAAIKGYAATLRKHGHKLGRAEREEFLQAIDEASDRLDVMISRLLELSQLEAGMLRAHLAPVDALQVVREAIAATEHRWRPGMPVAGQCTFIAPEQTSAPPVHADLRLLRETLDIVLGNAVKYSPLGGAIQVSIQRTDRALTITVQDHGIGIAADHLQQIVHRFDQVDTCLASDVEHAGVGLAICQRIIALHHGEITAESELGVGSSFAITLPLENVG